MAIAQSIQSYLQDHSIPYDIVRHPRSLSSMRTAQVAHVPGDRLAKAVLLEDESGYVMAVLPSTRKLDLGKLRHHLDRMVGLAVESEIGAIFRDCDPGAIPALGEAYDVETVVDDTLLQQPEVYFEAGDHEELIHMSGREFRELMADFPHGRFSYRV